MTDQPSPADAPHGDPTAPPPPPAYPPPAAYAPPADYPTPTGNPYGDFRQAPQLGPWSGGRVAVGSLPYVEYHFGPVTTFGDRVLPAIIDSLLVLIGLVPMLIGMFIMGASSGSGSYDEYGNYVSTSSGAGVAVGLFVMALGVLLMIAIQLWNRVFKQGRTGQSVGKKMMGLKLVNATSGQPIGPGMAFVRDLVNGVANQVVYLGYLWMLWDPNRQTLGDMVAKSTVIKVPKG